MRYVLCINFLCLITGHAKFAAVSISLGYLRRFAELHDEYVLTWTKCFYVAIPTLQIFHTHLVVARNSAQRVAFTHRVTNSIPGQLASKGRVCIKCLEFIFRNLTIKWYQ